MSFSGSHNALHPKGTASLWDWLIGTARYLHCTHNNMPHSQPTLFVGNFRMPLCLLCSGAGQRAVCPSVQFRATFLAEHGCGRGLGHRGRPRPCATAQHSSAWCLQKANIVWLCIMWWCIAPRSWFFLSALFSLLGFNFLLLLNFVK